MSPVDPLDVKFFMALVGGSVAGIFGVLVVISALLARAVKALERERETR